MALQKLLRKSDRLWQLFDFQINFAKKRWKKLFPKTKPYKEELAPRKAMLIFQKLLPRLFSFFLPKECDTVLILVFLSQIYIYILIIFISASKVKQELPFSFKNKQKDFVKIILSEKSRKFSKKIKKILKKIWNDVKLGV